MPPRVGVHRSQPSQGLAGDNEQLSPMAHPRLSPAHHSIAMHADEEEEHAHIDAIPYGNDEATDDDGDTLHPSSDSIASQLDASTDPSLSGEFDPSPQYGCLVRTWRAVLNFPSLSLILPLTLVLSLFTTFLNEVVAHDAFMYWSDPVRFADMKFMPSPAGFGIQLTTTIILVAFALLATRQLLYQLVGGQIQSLQIIGLYLATILLYGELYFTAALLDPETSFMFEQGQGKRATTKIVSVWVAMQYFSVTTITNTGFGDIYPTAWFPKLVAMSELLMSLFYHIGIFAIGLEHFQRGAQAVAEGQAAPIAEGESFTQRARDRMRNLRQRFPRLDALRRFCLRYVFAVSFLLQLGFLLVLHLYDADMFNRAESADDFILFIFFIAQATQFLLILFMSLALVRQVSKSAISPAFLFQSWLATVFLFTGLYTLIYLLVPGFDAFHLWNGVGDQAATGTKHAVVEVVFNLLWLSLSTMTTAGFGDVYPVHLVARLCVSAQMIISVVYTVVILGQALASTVGLVNAIRMERGAATSELAQSKRGSGGASSSLRPVPEEEDEAEEISMSDLRAAGGRISISADQTSASEIDEDEPALRAQQRQQQRATLQKRAGPPQPPRQPPVMPAVTGARVAAKARQAAAAASGAVHTLRHNEQVAEAQDAIAETGRAVAHAASEAAQQGVAQVRKSLPGAMAAGQRAAQVGKAAAQQTAAAASAAVEARAPGLQAEVAREARTAANQAATAARTGASAATAAAHSVGQRAMSVPAVGAAVRAAAPQVESARQTLAQAGAKARLAAQQSAAHMREQSRGMFDVQPDEMEDDELGVQR